MRKPWLTYLAIFFLSAAVAIYIRLYPLWGHIWSPTQEQATMAVIVNLKKTFLEKIHEQYPQMPPEQVDRLAGEKLNQTLHHDNANVRRAIERINQTLSQHANAPDPIYLLEADPFYFYNLTENIVAHGRIAEKIQGNKYFNPLMGAPFGYWQPFSIHPYIGFCIYKAACLFDPSIRLMSAVAFTPLVLSFLALLAFIWCARLFALGPGAVLAGSFYFALAPIFLKRSSLGWYDTDPYHVLFSLLFIGIFLKTLKAQTWRGAALAASTLALMLILYSLIWQGWVFLFFMTFICAGAIACFAGLIQKNTGLAKILGLFSISFLLAITAVGSLIYGFGDFLSFFSEGQAELNKFTVKGMNLWPNLFIEVGELKKSSFAELMSNTGGPVFLLGVGLGLIMTLRQFIKCWRQNESLKIILVFIFLLVTVVLTFKAERFAIFTLPPLCLLFAFGIDASLNYLGRLKYGPVARWGLVFLLLGISWFNANKSIRTVLTPIYNSAWDEAMVAIRQNTPKDSIINTWWPPGHFIKGVAQRRVPFDGASLSEGAVGYWMANILLSTNEDEARGLLRMLNLSGNRAVEFLTDHGIKTSVAVALLKVIASKTRREARETLKPFMNNEDDLKHLLLLTHGGSPHSYVLIYNELVDQNIGLVFVGRRNFQKIEAINADPEQSKAIPSPDSKGFIDFLWTLCDGPVKYSPALSLLSQDDQTLNFSDGISVRKDYGMALINSPQYGTGIPTGIMFREGERVISQDFAKANLNYVVVIYEKDGQTVCRLMDKNLAESLIMRMFFFDGLGLKNFKLLNSSTDLTARTQIKTFETLWD